MINKIIKIIAIPAIILFLLALLLTFIDSFLNINEVSLILEDFISRFSI